MITYSLDQLNEMPAADFVQALGQIFEHSPWVVEAAALMRPFPNTKTLLVACENALYGADAATQLALIRAHPDLAAKLDQLPKLTEFSQQEQGRAGFAALAPEVLQQMREALARYTERFGHPFILCVTEHPAEDVLPLLQLRTAANADAERLACLFQIARIGWHRICSLVDTPSLT
jgi:2-oxo-4-hydroxy-4-carboxy-5-ureidoimidazoline decarboxylase